MNTGRNLVVTVSHLWDWEGNKVTYDSRPFVLVALQKSNKKIPRHVVISTKNRSAPFLDLKLIDQTYPLTYIHHHQGMGSMVQIPGALVCMSTQFFVPQFISISTSVIWSHWWQHFDGYIASWSILPMLKSQVVTKSPLQIVKINHYLYHHMSW
jgi:hypothetical protein